MKKFFFLFCTLFVFAQGATKFYLLSDEAYFDGKDLLVTGHVKVSADLGYMLCEKAYITDIKNDKGKTSFLLLAEGNIQTHLLKDLDIQSDMVKFVFPERFFSFASFEVPATLTTKVPYKNQSQLLTLSAQKMDFQLADNSLFTSSHPIKQLLLEENVEANYGEDCRLQAGKVSFSSTAEEKDILVIHAQDEQTSAKFSQGENSFVFSRGEIDVVEKELLFENCKGHIISSRLIRSQYVDFSSQKLTYEQNGHRLVLKEKAHMDIPLLGLIQSDEIQLYQNERLPQKNLKKICALGDTSLFLYDKTGHLRSHLVCAGSLILDNELQTLSASASHQSNNKHPLIYNDERISLYAQKANVQYTNVNNHYIPGFISIENGLHFIAKSFPEKTSYGIADLATYDPQKKLIELKSNPQKRVLFWQEDDALRLSAPEIHIQQLEDKSQFIQGIGDVRFFFNINEKSFLSELFKKNLEKK